MYLDNTRTKAYTEHLKCAAHDYQEAQYDVAVLQHWLGRMSAGFGHRLVIWGQRLQAEPAVSDHWHTPSGNQQLPAQ